MKAERLDVRVRPDVKETLLEASRAAGTSLSQFVIDAALGAAEAQRDEHLVRNLAAEDREAFLAMLDERPSAALRDAFERVRRERAR